MKKLLQKLSLYPSQTDLSALYISFLIINFAFLYHSLTFMWGNHDVAFVKTELLLSSGLFEGRFTQFIPYRLLTNGQILPILNNLIGFTFLTIALWILAKYWQIPTNRLNYILFITFFATEPYTLSWMYFSFITISCLLWTLLAILGLYLSELTSKLSHKKALSFIAILCFYTTLGGYPPIINTFFVCLSGRIVISYLFENKTLYNIFQTYRYTILNILVAALLFKLTLKILPTDNVYNLETTPLNELPAKFISTIQIAFRQFFITTPFMELGYKTLLALMSFCAIIGALFTAQNWKHRTLTIVFIFGTIWSTALTTFLVIPHTEYVSRIDFYGFAFLYAFFLALLLKYKANISHSLALIFMFFLIPLNIINDYRAQKVWKQGFDAEFAILDRITERIENHPAFNPNHQYRFYQVGDISLRPNYYQGKYDINDVFLLTLPYLAMWQGANLIEFYSPHNYINHKTTIFPSDITPEIYHYFITEAKPFPHPSSIFVNDDIIIIIYNQAGLDEFREKIRTLYPKI
ncbi:MAG: glucosyltransferase domain-containing protein [Acetobacter sp.]|nr:glucosyltransferase domain-containing protein [Acetobacter sp.]